VRSGLRRTFRRSNREEVLRREPDAAASFPVHTRPGIHTRRVRPRRVIEGFMNGYTRSWETMQTQIGACGFTELNRGNAPVQSTALPLDVVPGVDPDTVTLSPDVGMGKLVDPLPMTIVV
jgi:hypothetical protein